MPNLRPSARCRFVRGPLAACLSAALLLSCYHYRVAPARSLPADEAHSETVHSLFWGFLQSKARQPDCQGNGAAEVVATTNLGYTLLSIVTLGIWSPLQLEWRCAKDRLHPETGLD